MKRILYLLNITIAFLLIWLLVPATSFGTTEKAEYIALSLREAQQIAKDKPGDEYLKRAGDMVEYNGFIIDRNTNDIIIFGRKSDRLPPLSLDDFVFILRSSQMGGLSGPGMSLEPSKDISNDKLQVVFFGGTANSTAGKVSYEADYLMKKIALDVVQSGVNRLQSYTQRTLKHFREEKADSWSVLSRFWFAPIYAQVIKSERDDLMLLKKIDVGVFVQTLSADINGKPAPAGFEDEPAKKYGMQFMNLYDELAEKHIEFANLSRFMGASKLMTLLLSSVQTDALNYWLSQYQTTQVKIPSNVPILRRVFDDGQRQLTLVGGVKMAGITLLLRKGEVTALRDAVLLARPSAKSLIWRVSFDEDWRLNIPSASKKDLEIANLFTDGLILHEKGDNEGAIRLFDIVLKTYPDVVEAKFLRAVYARDIAINKGKIEAVSEPLVILTQLVKENPQFIEVHYELGETLRIVGKTDEAIAEFKKTIEMQPEYSLPYYGLGLALKDKKDFSGAISALEKFRKYTDLEEQKEKTKKLIAQLETESKSKEGIKSSNYKNYSNVPHKFTCNYPENWSELSREQLIKKSKNHYNPPEDLVVVFVSPENYDDNVNIQVAQVDDENLSDKDIEDTIKELDKVYAGNYTDFKKIKAGALTVSGAKGFEYSYASTRLGVLLQQKVIIFVKSKRAYTITFTALKEHFEKLDNTTFQPLLESFRVQ